MRLGTDEVMGTEKSQASAADFTTYSEVLANPSGDNWTLEDVDDLQVINLLHSSDASAAALSQTSVVVTYYEGVVVTATGVASGEHEVEVAMDSPFLSMGIDATSDPITPVSDNLVMNAPLWQTCLLYTSPSPRDRQRSRMPSSA